MESKFDLALTFVFKAEGGYSNHPNDRGGQTNYGITKATFNAAKKQGIIDDSLNSVKDIILQDAKNIYKTMFWDEIKGDALPTKLSVAMFDTAVNMGNRTSVKMLQGVLGLPKDGVIGSQTLSAIQNYSGDIINDFLDARKVRYKEIVAIRPSQKVFLKGWLNRLNNLRGYVNNIDDYSFIPMWVKNAYQGFINELISTSRQVCASAKTVFFKDPLILDLDNDGLETINVADGAYFDHDGNGFAEQTGWAKSDDGLLVMDRNGNGTIDNGAELFGDQTILQNGQRATDGFQALAELDSNSDGVIDVNDTAFSNLRIWQDIDGDGYSASDELFTLQEMGIQSINVAHTDTNTPDQQGNTQVQAGTFTKTDGSTASIGGFNLQRDVTYSIANEWLDVPDGIAALPDLQGYGNTYDLHQAMARDTTGTLQSLINQFIAAEDPAVRDSLMEQILFKWTGSDTINPASRGPNFDARKLVVIEKLMGQPFYGANGSDPNSLAAPLLAQAYEGLFEMYYAQIMAQTHLKYVYDAITYTWDETTQSLKGDLNPAIAALQSNMSSNQGAANDPSEFMRTIHGFRSEDMFNLIPISTTFELVNEDVNWQIDSAGRTILSGTGANDTFSADAGVNTAIRGDLGNDVLYGNTGSDVLYGNEGDDMLIGGCADDWCIMAMGGVFLPVAIKNTMDQKGDAYA